MAAPTNYAREAFYFYGVEDTAGTKKDIASATYVKNVERDSLTWELAGPALQGISHNAIRQHLDGPGLIPTSASYWNVSFAQKVRAQESSGSVPEVGPILQACGFTENSDQGYVYSPTDDPNSSTDIKSLTLRREQTTNGAVYEAHGVRGNVSLNYDHANGLMLSFAGVGCYNTVVAQSTLTVVTDSDYNSGSVFTVCDTFNFLGADLDGIKDFEIDTGYGVSPVPDVTNAAGYFYQWPAPITRGQRMATGRFTGLLTKAQVASTFSGILEKTENSGQIIFTGPNSTQLQLDLGKVQVTNITWAEVDSARIEYTISFVSTVDDSGNASLAFTWTGF